MCCLYTGSGVRKSTENGFRESTGDGQINSDILTEEKLSRGAAKRVYERYKTIKQDSKFDMWHSIGYNIILCCIIE